MALKCVVVLCFLWLLQSSEAQVPDYDGPPLRKACSDQEEQENLGAFSQECRIAFDNLDFTNPVTVLYVRYDPLVFTVLCSDACSSAHTEYIEECYPDLVELQQGSCLYNENEEMCYTAVYNSLVKDSTATDPRWQDEVRAECYGRFTDFADNTPTQDCSDACKEGLRQANDELGCCLNSIYNNSFTSEYLPFAEYSLWSNCGLESEAPGFCSTGSASALPMGIYSIFAAVITLGTVLF